MKTKKENKIDRWLILGYAMVGILVFMTGISAGMGQWVDALCNALWIIVAVMNIRNYLLSKETQKEIDNDIKHLIRFMLLGDILADKKNKQHEDKPMSSAAVNEETEMGHNGEGVGED